MRPPPHHTHTQTTTRSTKQLRPKDYICRDSHNECDLPEYCDSDNGHCPMDVYKKNGSPCGHTKAGVSGEYNNSLWIKLECVTYTAFVE